MRKDHESVFKKLTVILERFWTRRAQSGSAAELCEEVLLEV